MFGVGWSWRLLLVGYGGGFVSVLRWWLGRLAQPIVRRRLLDGPAAVHGASDLPSPAGDTGPADKAGDRP